MRIPPYWIKGIYGETNRDGDRQSFEAFGWSFESLAAAKKDAAERARRVCERICGGRVPDEYDYLDRPLREEIVQTLKHGDREIGLITRNRYGSLVLNTASACFVDVDFPQVRARGLLDTLMLAFSKKRWQARAQAAREETTESIRSWSDSNPRRTFRLYRTLAGLRLLFTDRLYDPTSTEVASLLDELGSDPLYRQLTTRQECFRARLSPKPWRCGSDRPPNRFPWDSSEAEAKYRNWQRDYEHKSRTFGTCRLVDTFGHGTPDEHIASIVDAHDRHACRGPQSQLA